MDMDAVAFSVIIFFPNLVKAYDLFKIWKLGHTHTHTHTHTHVMAVMWSCFFLQGTKSDED